MIEGREIERPVQRKEYYLKIASTDATRRASNRQKKLLRFFGVPFKSSLSVGAAGAEIDKLMAHDENRELWQKYLYFTKDFDSDSDQLRSYSLSELANVQVPKGWSSKEALEEYQKELAAEIMQKESPFDDPQSKVTFKGKVFLLTGQFAYGSRKECLKAITLRGGIASEQKEATQTIDYLVVGAEGNKKWSKGSYGNKIESAVLVRRQYGKPAIITEEHWVSALKENDPQMYL